MAALYRVGPLNPHHGRFFAAATLTAARLWAVALGREGTPISEINLPDDTLVVVSTHGYVEADWRYGDFTGREWDDPEYLVSLARKAKVFRLVMPAKDAVELLALFEGEPEYDAHEISWA